MNYKNQVDGARALKQELKRVYPDIKFSVRSEIFSGGNSIHVDYELGAPEEEVRKIANKYEQGYFDGMVDLYEYKEDQSFIKEHGGANYVLVSRHIPEDIYLKLLESYCNIMLGAKYEPENPYNSRIFNSDGSVEDYAHFRLNMLLKDVDFRDVKKFEVGFKDGELTVL